MIQIPLDLGAAAVGVVGLLVSIIGVLLLVLLRLVLSELREVKTQTAPIPGLVVQVQTLGREMGERKDWEGEHIKLHLTAQGD